MSRGAALAIVVAASFCLAGSAHAQSGRVLVMPFENVQRDSRIFWLSEGASVLLADDLNAMGGSAISRQERQQAFERLQVPPVAVLTDATVFRIGQLVGAERVVVGTLQLDGESLIARARLITLDTGRVQADVTDRGSLQDLYAIVERMARRMLPSSGRSTEEVERQHPPLPAFESFIKGVLAETPETAIAYLRQALTIQPSFDRARLALWDVYTDQGEHEQALRAVASVADGSPSARRAHVLGALSQLELKKYDEAAAAFRTLIDVKAEPALLNDLGVVQLRKTTPATADKTDKAERATAWFRRAADADPDDPDYAFNLGYAFWLERDTQAAIYWLREVVRRAPADGEAHYVLGAALTASGNAAEAAREKELARRLSSSFAAWDKRPANDAVPKGLERIKNTTELPHAQSIGVRIATSEQRDQAQLAHYYLDSARRQFERENDREATQELNRALYLSPYLADAHLLLGRIHLRNGRVREAIDAFKISIWSAETADAHVALGEAFRQDKDLVAARAEAERALALDPASADAKALIARIEGR